jgi:hypothetical protein
MICDPVSDDSSLTISVSLVNVLENKAITGILLLLSKNFQPQDSPKSTKTTC